LKPVSLAPLRGYSFLSRIGQISARALLIEHRRAKFYELTSLERKRLREKVDRGNRLAAAVGSALAAPPEEL
jgi:hypothetical protein